VIILARGGGSIEDLWAFNNETLAYEIAQCATPIISGVGHEIDFTIADFVADLRAPTPSAAAEQAVPDQIAFLHQLQTSENHLIEKFERLLERRYTTLHQLQGKLKDPKALLQNQMQRLDYAQQQLFSALEKYLTGRRSELQTLAAVLDQQNPLKLLKRGYVVLRHNGEPVTSKEQVKPSDKITAEMRDGLLELTVC
jgi:exodeoxyribonuclease VII large subunit